MHRAAWDQRGNMGGIEACYARGWTTACVVPTDVLVDGMLAPVWTAGTRCCTSRARRAVTAEKAAIRGDGELRPECAAVGCAALQAIGDPASCYGPATSVGGSALMVSVNGPSARGLELNGGANLWAPARVPMRPSGEH